MFYVYLLKSKKTNLWYTDYAKDLRKRILEHNSNKNFSTRNKGSFELIYYEASHSEKDARARERYLKSGMGKGYLKNRLKFFFLNT